MPWTRPAPDEVDLVVLREGKELTISIHPSILSTTGTSRVIIWAGLAIQATYLEVAMGGFVPEGVCLLLCQWRPWREA